MPNNVILFRYHGDTKKEKTKAYSDYTGDLTRTICASKKKEHYFYQLMMFISSA